MRNSPPRNHDSETGKAKRIMTDEFRSFLADLEFWITQHYLAENYYALKQQSDRLPYDWRCSYCVENSTECLFGDSGCPYRQPRKEVCAT